MRRCLAKQPGERFSSMLELKAALQKPSPVGSRRDAKASIAVLPFENMSGDKENEYFSDGLAEEIINLLAKIPDLKVIARTSAFAFKGKHEDIRRIAAALGVTSVLEGSVRKSGNRIRVTAQLISAADGSHLWSERYDRQLADVFTLQDEIATAITAALQVTLTAPSAAGDATRPAFRRTSTISRRSTTPSGAHQTQWHARRNISNGPSSWIHSLRRRTRNSDTCLGSSAGYGVMSPRDALPLMREEARRALAIDPLLPEGHAMLGTAAAWFDFDWPEAERHFRFAMAQGAVAPLVHLNYAMYCLLPTGRAQEAVDQYTLGLNEDPLNLMARAERAVCLRSASRIAEGNDELRQLIELDETFFFPYFMLGGNLAADGASTRHAGWPNVASPSRHGSNPWSGFWRLCSRGMEKPTAPTCCSGAPVTGSGLRRSDRPGHIPSA